MLKKWLLIAYFFIGANCKAQYPFVHYTPKDGLVNSRVRKAYQDSRGRMYFMTFGGLSMYDGARFRNYTLQNGLLADLVNDVLEVGEDSLLVAVNTCGLNMLVRGQMKKLKITGDYCPIVNHFLKCNDGTIYATTDDGLYLLKENHFEKLSTSVQGQTGPVIFLGAVAEYRDFLVFTTNDLRSYTGLFLFNKKNNTVADALPQLSISSLTKGRNGIIWLITAGKAANLDTTALAGGKLVLINPYSSFIKSESFGSGVIAFNLQDEPLISSSNDEIIRYRKDGTALHIAAPELSGFTVQNFFISSEDVLWICYDGNGIYKLSNTKLQASVSFFGENNTGVKTIMATSPDSCWVLMNNNELILHTAQGNKNFSFPRSIDVRALHFSNKYMYAAGRHKLYTAKLPQRTDKKISLKQILSIPNTSSFGDRFVSDPYGSTILFEKRNICVMQNEKLIFTYPLNMLDLIEGMYVDKNKQLWLVSRGAGLQVFDIHPEDLPHYLQKKYQFIKEFEGASARCITVDKSEFLWVGTRYDGLLGFEYKNGQLIKRYHLQTQDGLTDNFIITLACDKNNNILVGTQTGLDRVVKTKHDFYHVENVTKSNNIFSCIKYVWAGRSEKSFALTNGGTVFQVEPVQPAIAGYEPQLLIEEIKVNGQPIIDFGPPLHLQYEQRNITFSLAAPTFIDEKQVRYSYLLYNGGTKKWSDTSAEADITLLNLSPGNYTLRVKAFFSSTTYTPKEKMFSFVISPPWWQTWWARTGIGIFGIGILVACIRFYYSRKLEKQKNILDKQQVVEKERTRIAADIHDDLGAGLSTIRFLSEKVKRNSFSAVTKTDAEKIVTNANELVQKMNELIWAMNEKNDTLEDLLFYTRAYSAEYAEENNLQLEINLPEAIPAVLISGELRRNVFLTVKESLHNIVKHARAKNVSINISAGKNLMINIKDDGVGFSETDKHEGNGLKNMQKRMESVGGNLEIINNNGVQVTINVLLK